MSPLVSIEHVSHSFGSTRVLDDVSLSLAPDSYTVLLGPSGSGKTTLLSILGGFLNPEQGRVMIRGQDCTAMAPAKRPTATVFQDYALFPHMSIGANIGFGLRMKGVAKAERDARASAMLDVVDANGLSALMLACTTKCIAGAMLLIEAGAALNLACDGGTALDFANEQGLASVSAAIRARGGLTCAELAASRA